MKGYYVKEGILARGKKVSIRFEGKKGISPIIEADGPLGSPYGRVGGRRI